MDIIIDTSGQADLRTKNCLVESDEDDLTFEEFGADTSNLFDVEVYQKDEQKTGRKPKPNSTNDVDLDEFESDMGWKSSNKRGLKKSADVSAFTVQLTPLDKVLQKSAIKPGFEQLEAVPPYDETKKRLQAQRRKEREKTKGKKWFNMPAPEMTEQVKHDLEVIKMRSVLDPKHFYKKNDLKVLPKYFHIGKVMDSPVDYYSDRLTKKERKSTIVDELMADAEFSKFNKRKYKEIIDEKQKLHYKAHRHARKLKAKKK